VIAATGAMPVAVLFSAWTLLRRGSAAEDVEVPAAGRQLHIPSEGS